MIAINWADYLPNCTGNHWTVPVAFCVASLLSFYIGYWGGKNGH